MEDVWSVSVYQDTVTIELVKCISRNVFALVDHHNAHASGRAALCDHAARKSSSHNKNVSPHAIDLQLLRGLCYRFRMKSGARFRLYFDSRDCSSY